MDTALYSIGQIVEHKMFAYRGVIYDVDPCFLLTEEWYTAMARSRPPRDKPWYKVLVHNAGHSTYVAEQNLRLADLPEPISHPEVEEHFSGFYNGRYISLTTQN